jgi:hypothetical protein
MVVSLSIVDEGAGVVVCSAEGSVPAPHAARKAASASKAVLCIRIVINVRTPPWLHRFHPFVIAGDLCRVSPGETGSKQLQEESSV